MNNKKTKNTTMFFCVAIAMLFLNSNSSFAQRWQLSGNSSLTLPFIDRINVNSFVGSTDANIPFNLKTTQAQPMIFFTTNTERMRITPTGFVGINIANPQATLDVNGTIKISSLACDNCFVTTDEKGNLTAQENTIAQLEQRIKQLEDLLAKMEELEKQLAALTQKMETALMVKN